MTSMFNPYVKAYPNEKKFKSWMPRIVCHLNPPNFIYKHTVTLENIQKIREKKRANLQGVKLAQTKCQNLSIRNWSMGCQSQ